MLPFLHGSSIIPRPLAVALTIASVVVVAVVGFLFAVALILSIEVVFLKMKEMTIEFRSKVALSIG